MVDEADDFMQDENDEKIFNDEDIPNTEIGSPTNMAVIDGITQEWEEKEQDVQGDTVPPSPASMTDVGSRLESLIGPEAFNDLETIYSNRGQDLAGQITIGDLPTIGHIEVQNDKDDNPSYILFYDTDGTNITAQIVQEMGISTTDNMTQRIGESGLKFGQILQRSNLSTEVEGSNQWSPSSMGQALTPHLENFISTFAATERRGQLNAQLQHIRSLMLSLGNVFAFDDYRHLEAFMAAWMMKDSTCRLSGVPGTGKTTVIECAATLLSNSYGFNSIQRLCVDKDYQLGAGEEKKIYAENDASTNIYTPTIFPAGQQYNITYGNISRPEIKALWEDWRFNDWSRPKKIGSSYAYVGADGSKRSYVRPSGSYLYDFRFLQPMHDDGRKKVALQPEAYRNLLLQHYYVDVPFNFDVNNVATWPSLSENGTPIIPPGVASKRIVKPVKIMNAEGAVNFDSSLTVSAGEDDNKKSIIMQLAYPEMDKARIDKLLVDITDVSNQNATDIIANYMEESGLNGLYSDAGRNEGYWLREFLHETCYDSRAKPGEEKWSNISQEMIAEIGIAKVDYEKRADEVLYGMEIRETAGYDAAKGAQVSTFDFEPTPRPIVTQPVKFFNEANRSKAGMEDAILGLIAEKKVEYRGKEFDSPNFVAWMDTNPHQKGNDLAFTDRIDMELLFKSVSLGGRYNILSGKGGGKPVLNLVRGMTRTDAVQPLRFQNLRAIWDYISDNDSGIQMTQPGGAYDGFRDIASISVLFSQAYRVRKNIVSVGTENQAAAWVNNPHESPLVDYSTTTNTTSTKDGNSSPVLKQGTDAFASQATTATAWSGDSATTMQLPAIFTRVLGFRFTNSLSKLSRAFAFLRGKTYVSREDIVDAVPYVCAHRIGRSREGLTDSEGNTKGIPKEVAEGLGYNNEQEFLRDVLVNGYLNRDIDIGQGQGASLLEMLDSFYERCISVLQSSDYAHDYEGQILSALQSVFVNTYEGSAGNLATNTTPVHWHIATMVSESERNGQTILRKYNVPEANKRGYPEMYSYYLQKITTPVNVAGAGDSCLYDILKVRNEILNNPNLFSDDKARLISLADEEIAIMASTPTQTGRATDIGPINNRAFQANTLTNLGVEPTLPLLSYGDRIGAWAQVTSSKPPVASVRNVQSGLDMTGRMFDNSSGHEGISGQQLKLVGRIQQGSRSGDSQEYGRFVVNLSRFINLIGPKISGTGRIILNSASEEGNSNIQFTDFMNIVKGTVKDACQPDADVVTFDYVDTAGETSTGSIDYTTDGGFTGISACFPIPHAAITNLDMGDITTTSVSNVGQRREVTTPIRTNDYDANLWRNREEDYLRLWLNICSFGEVETVAGAGTYQTFVFSATVTSNLAEYTPEPEGGATTTEELETVGTVTLLPMNDNRCYSQDTYTGEQTVYDSGNMTKSDREYYLGVIGDALQPRQS